MLAWLKRKRGKGVSACIAYDGDLPEMAAEPCLPVSGHSTLVARKAGRARELRGRIWLCLSVFVLIFSGLAVRLANITLIDGALAPAGPVMAAMPTPEGERPEIRDRNGVSLAMNRMMTGLAIDTKNVWNARETAEGLASVFPSIDVAELTRRIGEKKYIIIRNEMTAAEQRAVMTLGLSGLDFPETTKRVYPQGALAAHATGYTIGGRGGVAGLEYVADEHAGEPVLASSIDVRAQQILEEEIHAGMERFKVESAWGVIMKAKTGEVVALASLPGFNPNEVNASPADTWRNRAMQDRYELGSAFKVITAASVLEEGIASPETLYDARKPLKVYDRTIYDYHPRREIMSLSKVIQHSSNIGIARAALDLGRERQKDYFAKLGLTEALATELPEKRDPDLPERWGPVETATISYGHGIAVTPLQLTAAVSAVVNGGTYRTPTFLKVEGERAGEPVFSAETSAKMRLIMRQVITDGTASKAEAPGYYPIGKTATADKPGVGGYRKNARISSFVGAFPGYDPEYVILVSFDEPQGIEASAGYATAGWVAAPVFGNIVARMGPVLGIAPAHDDLAFAQFMSALRSSENVNLAMNDAAGEAYSASDTAALEVGGEMDDVARLLAKELGP